MKLYSTAQIPTSNFSATEVTSEVHNYYKFIKGRLSLVHRQPDGDSVAFIPDDKAMFDNVYRSFLLSPSKVDGGVQLRLEGIDAPEVHYAGKNHQPFCKEPRDFLLNKILSFKSVTYDTDEMTVSSSAPASIEAFIATNSLDTHGRPICFLFVNKMSFKNGDNSPMTDVLIKQSVNYKLVELGYAYLLAYSSLPLELYGVLKTAANEARSNMSGVWHIDTTRQFFLADLASIAGDEGQLIYPKLFRRCVDFLKTGEVSLKTWLRNNDSINDRLRITGSSIVTLSSIIIEEQNMISFQADTNDIIFIEK